MITSLAKLGATQQIQIILDYGDSLTATVLFKSKQAGGPTLPPLSISGTITEVEAHLATDFTANVEKVAGLRTNIDEAVATLEKEKKAKTEKTVADNKAEGKAKDGSNKGGIKKPTKPEPVEPPKKKVELSEAAAKLAASIATGAAPALEPAYKKPAAPAAPAPTDEEFASLFPDESQPADPAAPAYVEGSTH